MRTTIDLPDDLHRIAMSLARDTGQTLSQTVAALLRRALERPSPLECYADERTGFPVIRLGGAPITVDDVRALDDDE
ncbi:MAG: antitoxin [Pseudonocardiaceae bacterium]